MVTRLEKFKSEMEGAKELYTNEKISGEQFAKLMEQADNNLISE